MGLIARLKQYVGISADGYTIPVGNDDERAPWPSSRNVIRQAHRNPIVCAAVNWITDQVTTTPYQLTRIVDGESEDVPDHPILDVLRSPSEDMSGREMLSVSVWDLLTDPHGQCFWHIDAGRNGQVAGLTYLPAGKVKVIGGRDRLITEYEYYPEGTGAAKIVYPPDEVVHIRIEPDPRDPKNGLSPLACLAPDILMHSQSTNYMSGLLSDNGAPGGLLMPEEGEVLTDETASKTSDYLNKEFSGSKRGRLGVLTAHLGYVPLQLTPQAMAIDRVETTVVEHICGVLGVHPVIVGLGAGNAQSRVGAATKELERAAWTNRIIPLLQTIAEQAQRQLLPRLGVEAAEGYRLEWDLSGVMSLQPDLLQEAQRWAILMRSYIATRYDARVAVGLAADDGDRVYLQPLNLYPVPQGQPAAPPPEPTAEPEEQTAVLSLPTRTRDYTLALMRSKADLTSQQRALLLALARDAGTLEEEFTGELEAAFEDLGQRAEEAYWEMEGGRAVASALGQRTKQTDDELEDLARRILSGLAFSQWEQGVLIPAWDGHTLRTLNLSVGTVNATLGLEVNIPDPVRQRILASGGTRRGLVDIAGQTRESIFQALRAGSEAGEGIPQLARRIRADVPAGPYKNAGAKYRAQLIARTEVAEAQNLSAYETYRASDVYVGVVISDGDEDDLCAAVNGRRMTFAEYEQIGFTAHPNCTRAAAPISEL